MGINKNDCKILFYSKTKLGVSFSKTLTLGRLELYVSKKDIEDLKNDYSKLSPNQFSKVKYDTKYSEPLFELLGAKQVDSLDFSNYEEATIIHDLNKSISEEYHNRFSAIVDGGTIEHVFNFPVAIKSCMDSLEVGGFYIGITPINNQMGHGFYQFSPELYFRIFSPENGFIIREMFVRINDDVYRVSDPKEVKSRIELTNSVPTYLIVIAEKIENKPQFQIPQQSDYVNTWNIANSIKTGKQLDDSSLIMNVYRRMLPTRIKTIFRNIYDIITKEKKDDENLGVINPLHYHKIELSPTIDKEH